MDDERLPILDVGEEPGSQSAIRDHLDGCAGNRVRFDHARLQHALCVLHRPANARCRAESLD